jgi:exopolysaccharide biosynthesis WecB/TagA/CpsF family protein
MKKIQILNINILSIDKKSLLNSLVEGVLFTPNVDHLVKLQKDKEFYETYKRADYIICDSKIIYLALKFLKTPISEVIPGSSFFSEFYEHHKYNNEIKIFLLGAAQGVADKAKQRINNRIGRNIIVGSHSPSFGFEQNEEECSLILNLINSTDANTLVVGVGAPKQEKWIFKYKEQLPKIKLFMALGATIDFEAGTLKRAPKIFQQLYLEWFYRMCREPKRLVKRYLIDDIPFFYYLVKQKIEIYKNPFRER